MSKYATGDTQNIVSNIVYLSIGSNSIAALEQYSPHPSAHLAAKRVREPSQTALIPHPVYSGSSRSGDPTLRGTTTSTQRVGHPQV